MLNATCPSGATLNESLSNATSNAVTLNNTLLKKISLYTVCLGCVN